MLSVILYPNINFKAQNVEIKNNNHHSTISYQHKKEISVEKFFHKKMKVEKDYKVSGRKFEIFYEKDDLIYCGKNLTANKNIKVDTLYIIPKRLLLPEFSAYHLDGYQVRDAVYQYLRSNVKGFTNHDYKNHFIYKVDKNIITVMLEQVSHKYLLRKSIKYLLKVDTAKLEIQEFKKL